MARKTLLLIFIFYVIRSSTETDPCKKYKTFSDIRKRIPSNVIKAGTPALSDLYITEGWYGDEGIEIPTKKTPGILHCGTIYPVYLKDEVSKSGKEESHQLCIDIGSNTCSGDYRIKTKYCKTFSVYYLIRLGQDDAAYCAGPPLTGGEYPSYTAPVKVDVTTEKINNYTFGFVFTCKFNPSTDSLWYTVDWLVNDVLIYTSPTAKYSVDFPQQTSLVEKTLKAAGITTVGFQVKCRFKPRFKKKSSAGLATESKNKFIGIKILTPKIEVKEDGEHEISVRATAPIGCQNFHSNCNLTINVYNLVDTDPKSCSKAPIYTHSNCGIHLSGNHWDKYGKMTIHAKATKTYGTGVILSIVHLQTLEAFSDHPIWAKSYVGEITVHISKDTKTIENKVCRAVCDPHMLTFRQTPYEHQYQGIFTLYRNEDLEQEVEIQTEPCNNNIAQCICGMVVRSGKMAYTLNHCGNRKRWHIGYSLCHDIKDLLTVEVHGHSYTMYFGSGTRVQANLQSSTYSHFMDVFIYPSNLDVEKSDGLCGRLYKDPKRDEFYKRKEQIDKSFSESWRVSRINSLFDVNHLTHVKHSQGTVFICNCEAKNSKFQNSVTCSKKKTYNTLIDFKPVRRCKLHSRTKRSDNKYLTDRHPQPENIEPHVSNIHHVVKKATGEDWRNGWTEAKAKQYCTDLFNKSAAVQRCEDVPNVDSIGPLKNCILDIKLMGDTSFSSVGVETIKNKCYHEVEANLTLQTQTEPNQPSIFDQIKEVACPNECSQQGTCNNGACDCEENFRGVDCSVDIRIPPLVDSLGNDGYCDLADDDCSEISAFGGIFVDAENSNCKFRVTEVNENGTTEDKDEMINPVDIESISEAICTLPHTRQRRSVSMVPEAGIIHVYTVSVTNNGEAYSNESVVVVFNSNCQYCTIHGLDVSCNFTGDFCMSRSDCYGNGEPLATNECYLCSVNGTSRSWVYSTAPNCNPTKATSPRNKMTDTSTDGHSINVTHQSKDHQSDDDDADDKPLWIIGVVLGVAALICIAVFGLWYITKRSKRRVGSALPRKHTMASPPPYTEKDVE